MARHLIQSATTGQIRLVGTSALPFFQGYVELDTYDDGIPPAVFYGGGESDLRYVNVTELSDSASAPSVALRAAFVPQGLSRSSISPFIRDLAASPSTVKVLVPGDSTAEETNYAFTYSRWRTFHTTSGQAFAGMTGSNIVEGGNSGLTVQAWLPGTNGDYRPSDVAAATNVGLILPRFGTNDMRLGARTQAQLAADLRSMVALFDTIQPGVPLILTTPPTFTTTVVGTDYLGGATQAQAQARNDAMRAAFLELRDVYPHVLVLDAQAELWGTTVKPTSPYMTDQLHPNQAGQEAFADYIARKITEMGRSSGLAPAGRRFETDRLYVWDAGNGYIDVGKWTNATGPEGSELPLMTTDVLYSSDTTLASVTLTSATFIASGTNKRILKSGDWTAYKNKAAVITGDHPPEGVRGGAIFVTLDPASLAAGTPAELALTVTGATTDMGVASVQPPSNWLSTGLRQTTQPWVSAANTVIVPVTNPTGAAIDAPSGVWKVWLAR